MTQAEGKCAYFLGANTAQGFVSLYQELIDEREATAFYILKGGAGCGKSTLMKRIASEMERDGFAVEYILCSGDPDSLDAILIPEKKIAMVDGTAPHVIEPSYPGVLAHYINLGEFYKRAQLRPLAASFVAYKERHSAHYTRAYQYLRAARELQRSEETPLYTPEVLTKIEKRAAGILSRECKRRAGPPGPVRHRFQGAVSCQGIVTLFDSTRAQCRRIYELCEYAGLSHVLLSALHKGLEKAGYGHILCHCPEEPARLAQILIPELSLAFVTTEGAEALGSRPHRRLRLETMVSPEQKKQARSGLRFVHRIAGELREDAVRALRAAKELHDEIEAAYHPFVDFAGVERVTQALLEEVRNLP